MQKLDVTLRSLLYSANLDAPAGIEICVTKREKNVHARRSLERLLTSCSRFITARGHSLKLVSAIFINFFSLPNNSPSKTIKNVFYFIEKALFVLEIFKFF